MSYAAALAQTHFQYFADFGSHASAPIGQASENGAAATAPDLAVCSARRSTISSCRFAR